MEMGKANQSRRWSAPVASVEQGDSSKEIPLGSAVGRGNGAGNTLGLGSALVSIPPRGYQDGDVGIVRDGGGMASSYLSQGRWEAG